LQVGNKVSEKLTYFIIFRTEVTIPEVEGYIEGSEEGKAEVNYQQETAVMFVETSDASK
jgi:hypothetical protein